MLTLRIAGVLAVAAGCALMGNGMAQGLKRRVEALSQVLGAITQLEPRVLRRLDPLTIALEEAGLAAGNGMGEVFVRASALLRECGDPAQAVAKALKASSKGNKALALASADKDALLRFARQLGGDMGAQEAAFSVALADFSALMAQAERDRSQNERLYRTLGTLGGAAVALMLL